MIAQLRAACALLSLLPAHSARIGLHAAAEVNETEGAAALLTPAGFQHQIDTFVKPMYLNYNPTGECPFFAEGTVVLYCMDRDNYQSKLGKAAPGDIDFGHFCNGDGQEYLRKLGEYLPAPEGGKVSVKVGMIKVEDKVFMSKADGDFVANKLDKVALDVHQHYLPLGSKAPKRTAKYCLCDNECSNVPLAPLDDLKRLYTEHHRASKNDDKKVQFIDDLMGADGNTCGPCRAVPLDGRRGQAKPAVKPSNPLEAELASTKKALRIAREKKAAAEKAISTATKQLEQADTEIGTLEAKLIALTPD